jgi:hypothetical protein
MSFPIYSVGDGEQLLLKHFAKALFVILVDWMRKKGKP